MFHISVGEFNVNNMKLNIKQCHLKMTYTFLCHLVCAIFRKVEQVHILHPRFVIICKVSRLLVQRLLYYILLE